MSDAMSAVLFEHAKRPEWGLALLTQDGDDRRVFLFQDGRERTFKAGFFHFMVPADKPADVIAQVYETLAGRQAGGGRTSERAPSQAIPFETQLAVFRAVYPEGFEGAYSTEHRGGSADRRLKRHLDPAIISARSLLAKDALTEMIAAGDVQGVFARALEVVSGTELVPAAERRELAGMPDAKKSDFADALLGLLYGDAPFYDRMTRWLSALSPIGARVKWSLATALAALVHPDEHICVKPGPFAKVSSWASPPVDLGQVPDASVYERVLGITIGLRDKLQAAGLKPRDLLDVRTFIITALRPKNLRLIG